MNRHLFCTISVFLSGVSRIAIPLSTSIVTYSLTMALTGLANGGIDVGVNSWLLDMWHGDQSNMYMQFLHFSYALGSMISPFIAEPFLSYSTNETIVIFNSSLNENVTEFMVTHHETGIIYPYALCFGLSMICTIILIFLYFYIPTKKVGDSSNTDEWDPIVKDEDTPRYTNRMKLLILAIAGCVLSCETGLENNVNSYIQNFVTGHNYTKSKGAFVLSAMTACFTASRGISGFVAIKVPIKYILICSVIFMSIATATLQLLVDQGEVFLWLGYSLMGIGFGPFYAGLFSLVEKDIRVTTKVCGAFVLISSVSSIVSDLTTGKLIEKYLIVYSIFNWVSIMLVIPLFILLLVLLSKKLPPQRAMDSNSNVIKNES